MKTVYAVGAGFYEDFSVLAVFEREADAEAWVARSIVGLGKRESEDYQMWLMQRGPRPKSSRNGYLADEFIVFTLPYHEAGITPKRRA